jgi:hypothetical protein
MSSSYDDEHPNFQNALPPDFVNLGVSADIVLGESQVRRPTSMAKCY